MVKLEKGEDMTECYYCGSKLEEKKIDIIRYWRKEPFAINDVPTLVCTKCGEKYYSAKVSHKIDQIILNKKSIKKSPKTIEVPIFNWPQ